MGPAPHPARSAWDIDRRGLRLAALAATVLLGLATVVASVGLQDGVGGSASDVDGAIEPDTTGEPDPDAEPVAEAESEPEAESTPADAARDRRSNIALIALAVGAVALVVGAVAWLVQRRNDPTPQDEDELHGVTSSGEAIDLLAELLRPHDSAETPRQTIVRMYGALETGLGRPHLARRPHETPGRFVHRILGSHDALRDPLRDLVRAFEVARFSEHRVTEEMRDQAKNALASTRSYYAMHEVQTASPRPWVVQRPPAPVGH